MSLAAAPIEYVSAKDYGAKADGKADDTQAIQKALNAAVKKGGICFLPAGAYRLDGTLTVPGGVTLKGSYDGIPHPKHPIGTVLHIYGGKGKADATPTITLLFNASIKNMRWFEVVETRGRITDGKVDQWQVTVRVGFALEG